MTPLGHAALDLAENDYMRVFPCRVRSKEPLIHDNLNRATCDLNIIRGWWSAHDYNIGHPTGEGIWVLDLDGPEDEAWLKEREREHAPLPPTLEVITGRGRHLWFDCLYWNDPPRNSQNRDDMPDIRGLGGYVLVPPSVHPSGHVYTWKRNGCATVAKTPDWLRELVSGRQAPAHQPLAVNWSSFVGETFEGSHRGSAIARLAGLLLRKFVEPEIALDLCRLFNEAQCRPPLPDSELVKIVANINAREIERRARKQ